MSHDSPTQSAALEAFRLPALLRRQARARAAAEDLSFSQLMRRALRRELAQSREASLKCPEAPPGGTGPGGPGAPTGILPPVGP